MIAAATAVIGLALWVPIELKNSQPMLDLRSSRKHVLITNLIAILMNYSVFSKQLSTAQQLQMPDAAGIRLRSERDAASLSVQEYRRYPTCQAGAVPG